MKLFTGIAVKSRLCISLCIVTSIVVAAKATGGTDIFVRESMAYWPNLSFTAMDVYDVNAARYKTIAVCSVSDGNYIDGEWNGEDLCPLCVSGDYMYATREDECGIYRRSISNYKNDIWHQTNQLSYIRHIYGLSDGDILFSRIEQQKTVVYHSGDGGVTSVLKLRLSDIATTSLFSFHQAANGTVILAEYGPSGNEYAGRYLYRWDPNRKEFSIVYDATSGPIIDHFHKVCKQEALQRWIAVCGDNYRRLVASDDDGRTWYEYTAPNQVDFQPVELVDYGHPTKLLFGSDRYWMMGSVDVSGGTLDNSDIVQLIFDWPRVSSTNFCRTIFFHDGVWYVSSYSNGTIREPVIMVSKDMVHWAVYHQFNNYEQGPAVCLGLAGGKIHYAVYRNNVINHFCISPAQVELVKGIVIEPAVENLLDNSSKSSAEEGVSGWVYWPGNQPLLRDTAIKMHGDASFKISGTTSVTVVSDKIPVNPMRSYVGRMWVRGNNCSYLVAGYRDGDTDKEIGNMAYCHPNPNYWQGLLLEPCRTLYETNKLQFYLTVVANGQFELNIDAVQISDAPSCSWQLGSLPRAKELKWVSMAMPEEWTNVFTFSPASAKRDFLNLLGKKFYIKSWLTDVAKASLYYTTWSSPSLPSDAFVLTVSSGNSSISSGIKANAFQHDSQIRAAVVCYADEDDGIKKMKLYLSDDGPIKSVIMECAGVDVPAGADGVIKSGDINGLNSFAGIMAGDSFFAKAFDEDKIQKLLNTVTVSVLVPDGCESLCSGRDYNILWYAPIDVNFVRIEYSINDSLDWNDVAVAPNTGSYVWDVPSVFSDKCRIRVSGNSLAFSDISDKTFTIFKLKILCPNGGDYILADSNYTICWDADPCISNVLLEYSEDGFSWTVIGSTPNTGSFQWNVPNADIGSCVIRISDLYNLYDNDTSDSNFVIYQCNTHIDGDLNGDCYVNFGEVIILAEYWLSKNCLFPNWCAGSDFDHSGSVNFIDFSIFAQHWYECANVYDEGCDK